ncbi:MAG: hypothetical protein M1481_04125 [Candidatus Thermoplasmatota archaeon]|jgi:hypothetical protein|nr:hypothetical protein [Candidatus Thermoplasmatota archaeon]MCL5963186.1 hypothetical protein [Candidatus Thermoplasmatota archaeon]
MDKNLDNKPVFIDRECYTFNKDLKSKFNDKRCEHCKFYLTMNCKYINDFIDEMEDMEIE